MPEEPAKLIPLVTAHFPDWLDHCEQELTVRSELVNACVGLTFESEDFIRSMAVRIANQCARKS